MLAAGALAVVLVAHHHPADARGLVVARRVRHALHLTRHLVLDLVDGAAVRVDRANQHVVADVVQVPTELQPGPGHGDVVGRALALRLDQHGHVLVVLPAPPVKGLEQSEPLRGGVHHHGEAGAVGGRRLEGVLPGVEPPRGQLLAHGVLEAELAPAGQRDRVGGRVEGDVARKGAGRDQLGGGDERVGVRVAVLPLGEVAVVGGEDGVALALPLVPVPLADAGPAGVGQHGAARLLELGREPVALDRGAHLLGARGDQEGDLALEPGLQRLLHKVGAAGHILVGAVGAGADQSRAHLLGPIVCLAVGPDVGARNVGQVRGEGPVEHRLQVAQVDLNHLVVRGARVGAQVLAEGVRGRGQARAVGRAQVGVHTGRVGEGGAGGPDLGAHVADGAHARAADGVHALAVVLHDGARAALHRQDVRHLEDDVLGRGPAAEPARQVHANHLGALELPGHAGHHVHGVGAAHAHRAHAQAARVRRVRVRANHQATRESIVLQNNLVNDTAPRLPEPNAILCARRGKEIVNLCVCALSSCQVSVATIFSCNQVIAVNCRRDGSLWKARGDELKHSHLSSGVLHSNSIRAKLEVGFTTDRYLCGVI
mmetsp:Transcript_8070/g.13163  ORF Transcript_8070/g.13163 Transcript_8070/m.13163 type:complete len:599 (+) Transcript_8070:685-2481(+)